MLVNNDHDESLWYKDGIIYQVHIKAYKDSNNDGLGDIQGLIDKLDYVKSLGVTIIWMLPFYPSPLKDDGYDIADYLNINPDYGTIDDFKKLLREAHKRKIRIITELVLNHTSDQHMWFQRARKSPPGSNERNYYVWSDTPDRYKEARIIFQDFESSNWSWDPIAKAYYWHRFYSHQPDLNFENPQVHKSFFKVVDFWFEMGVDGLRLDAVPYLYEEEGTNCENLPKTHEFLKQLNTYIQSKFKNKMLLAEANQWPEDAVAYFGKGDECQMAFHFPLMPRIYMAVQMENRFPVIDILEQTPPIPENCQWAMFLRNHDELTLEMVTDEERDYMYRYFAKDLKAKINLGIRRRLAPLMENSRRKIELMNVLLFSFPGTPVIYYGDEIGMGDNYYLGDRNGVRTPMQWSPDRNAGFSDTNPQKLFLPVIIDPEYHYETVNVEVQERSTSSLLWWMKRALAIRKKYKAFGRGSLEFLNPRNSKVLAFFRKFEDQIILIVVNLSRYSQAAELDIKSHTGYFPVEIFSRNKFPLIQDSAYVLTLSPYDYYWFVLEKQKTLQDKTAHDVPVLIIKKPWKKFMPEDAEYLNEEGIMMEYLETQQLADSHSPGFQNIEIIDYLFLTEDHTSSIIFFRLNFIDRLSEMVLLPLKLVSGEKAVLILKSNIQDVIVRIRSDKEEMVLFDGIVDEGFRREFFTSVLVKKNLKGTYGELSVSVKKDIKRTLSDMQNAGSDVIKILPGSYNLQYDNKFFIKIYRRPEEGIQPGEELLNFFETATYFKNVPPLEGAVFYVQKGKRPVTLMILNSYVPHEGTAWRYFGDALGRYFENIVAQNPVELKNAKCLSNYFDALENGNDALCGAAENIFISAARLLGIRTGEMHNALAGSADKKDFVPEQFSTLYQRSLYQSVRTSIRNAFRLLGERSELAAHPEVDKLLKSENDLLNYAGKIVSIKIDAVKLRIHGDYHLGQVLFTGKDFLIMNFEGAAKSAVSERRLKRSPLRDIASMIWSFHFAAFYGLDRFKNLGIGGEQDLDHFARQWWYCMSGSFLSSYLDTVRGQKFIPADPEILKLMINFYLLDKSLNEMVNIIFSSPEKIMIPVDIVNSVIYQNKG